MKQNCGEEWQGPVFHNDQTYKTAAESMGSQKRLMESTFCFQQQKLHIHTPHTHTTHTHHTHTHHTHNTHTPHTHTHTHTHERYVQNVTPGTENLVVHVTIIDRKSYPEDSSELLCTGKSSVEMREKCWLVWRKVPQKWKGNWLHFNIMHPSASRSTNLPTKLIVSHLFSVRAWKETF